jgi:hypothetical protein
MSTWSDLASRSLRKFRDDPRTSVNPFDALEVQMALARLEQRVAEVQADERRFARAHHLYAARAAYDQALVEACRMAGVEELPESGPLRRVMAEAELRARGWSW